jgi:hypothetical protein
MSWSAIPAAFGMAFGPVATSYARQSSERYLVATARGDSAIMAGMRANPRPPYGGDASSWEQVAQLPGMDVSAIDLATLRQAVAVACTFTATDEEDALELLRRVLRQTKLVVSLSLVELPFWPEARCRV